MTTADKRTNIYLKKFLPEQQITENFLDYLLKASRDSFAASWPVEGVFYGGALSADGSDAFKVATTLLATDGLGRLLKLDPSEASAIKFENANGVSYYVGLRYNEIPSGTEVNVRTGVIQYATIEERIGELGQPNAVVDNGTTLTITVDSVAEAGVSNAGRKVRVWLKTAKGQADAFYEGTVYFSGGANKLDTTNILGQTAGAVSTSAADYQVFLIGPTVRRNTNLSLDPAIAYLGTAVGAGSGNPPASFTNGRNDLFPPSTITNVHDETKAFLVGGGLIVWDLSTSTLTWASPLVFRRPNRATNLTVAAGSQVLADGQIAYVVSTTAGGTVPLVIVAANSVPDDVANWPMFMRVGNDVHFKDGALELKGDAASTTGGRINDITADLLTFMGATDESDSDPNYPSTSSPSTIVTQGDSLTKAISDLNGELIAVVTNNPGQEKFTVGVGGQTTFTLSTFILDPNNTILDLEVYIDGRRMLVDTTGGLGEDYRKISTTQFQFSFTVPEGRVVTAWKQGTSYGGLAAPTSGKLWSDPMDASQIPNADAAQDVGSASRRIRESHTRDAYVNDTVYEITDLGTITRTKTMTSSWPAAIALGAPVAKRADGSIAPADSDGDERFIGFAVTAFLANGTGKVRLVGDNLPGVLTSLGFAPGDDIFIGETAGTYTNNPSAFSGANDDWIRVGIADCAGGTVSALATDLIVLTDVVARA